MAVDLDKVSEAMNRTLRTKLGGNDMSAKWFQDLDEDVQPHPGVIQTVVEYTTGLHRDLRGNPDLAYFSSAVLHNEIGINYIEMMRNFWTPLTKCQRGKGGRSRCQTFKLSKRGLELQKGVMTLIEPTSPEVARDYWLDYTEKSRLSGRETGWDRWILTDEQRETFLAVEIPSDDSDGRNVQAHLNLAKIQVGRWMTRNDEDGTWLLEVPWTCASHRRGCRKYRPFGPTTWRREVRAAFLKAVGASELDMRRAQWSALEHLYKECLEVKKHEQAEIDNLQKASKKIKGTKIKQPESDRVSSAVDQVAPVRAEQDRQVPDLNRAVDQLDVDQINLYSPPLLSSSSTACSLSGDLIGQVQEVQDVLTPLFGGSAKFLLIATCLYGAPVDGRDGTAFSGFLDRAGVTLEQFTSHPSWEPFVSLIRRTEEMSDVVLTSMDPDRKVKGKRASRLNVFLERQERIWQEEAAAKLTSQGVEVIADVHDSILVRRGSSSLTPTAMVSVIDTDSVRWSVK